MRSFKVLTSAGLLACVLLAGGVSALAAPALQPGYSNDPTLKPSQDFTGIWQTDTYEPHYTPVWGGEIPFTKEGLAQFRKNVRNLKTQPAKGLCLAFGSPRYYISPYPFMVQKTPRRFTFTHEENRTFRHIYMNVGHFDPDAWDPSYVGDSVAKWEGDTLVIDATNFNGKIWLDDAGTPTSDQLHLTERWRKLEDGRLEGVFTITDPVMFKETWTARRVFQPRPDVELVDDFVCGEKHRDLTGIKGIEKLVDVPPIKQELGG